MKPIRLAAQGLTSYKNGIEIDFSELDLFAITGPTGAGKSSIVEAICYALFGEVPRVGKNVKQLISLGADRLAVDLEFETDGQRYRIHRQTSRKTSSPPQLERFDPSDGEWHAEEVNRVKDTNAFLENLLRMDYEGFIRSVLLPQGDFAQFLAGKPEERRVVLDRLLRLGTFGTMAQRANTISRGHQEKADEWRRRLDEDLAEATPDHLRQAEADLEVLTQEAAAATAGREVVEVAARSAQKLSEVNERLGATEKTLAEAQRELKDAQEATATGKTQEAAHKKTIETLNKQLAANKYDEPAFLRYQRAAQLAVDVAAEVRAAADIERRGATLAKEATAAGDAADKAARALNAAHKAAGDAQDLYQEARVNNATVVVQARLNAGDTCPVCGSTVHAKPKAEQAPDFDRLKVAAEKAKGAEAAARKVMDAANSKRDQADAHVKAHEKNASEAAARMEARRKALAEVLAGEVLSAPQIATKLEVLAKARGERDGLREKLERETAELNAVVNRSAEAKGNLTRWQSEVERCDAEVKSSREQIAALSAALLESAAAGGWDDVQRALEAGTDTLTLLRKRLQDAQLHERATAQAIGSCQQRIKQIEKNIKEARELTKREREARAKASLARDLASMLQTNRFPTFVREQTLRRLAAAGSERLNEVSRGRYKLHVNGQDFEIEDNWGGGERRSVKTLSGGETFLASLALALALAEHLPGLGTRAESGTLESLFIDEGFSHLDNETLDDVAGALEVLGEDRRRLIGVITHVQALADRMPSRIVVHKSPTGSSVSVE